MARPRQLTRLETERLLLRPVELEDVDALARVQSDPDVVRYMGRPRDYDATLEWIHRAIEHQRQQGFGKWAVVERDAGEVIGHCGIAVLEDGPDVELGFCLARECWGRGYATEAAHAWLEAGFARFGFERVLGIVHPQNTASIRVLEKIGFVAAGHSRHWGRPWLVYEARP